ncbi:unnamed protein product, partial [Vitis vinifera]|uniref:Uncharacterized protein n=1 Tax=Vitis vinifera TaxID=29760 RepID=D7U0N1_VITVI
MLKSTSFSHKTFQSTTGETCFRNITLDSGISNSRKIISHTHTITITTIHPIST